MLKQQGSVTSGTGAVDSPFLCAFIIGPDAFRESVLTSLKVLDSILK